MSLPRAQSYASRTDAVWTPPATHAALYDAARQGGTQASRALVPDEALAGTAQALAERVASDGLHRTPAASVIQALSWSAGVIDPVPAVVVTRLVGNPPLDGLVTSVADTAQNDPYNRVGVGRARASDGSEIVVVALAQRRVTLQAAVPRRLAVGQRVQLNGELAAGLRSPEVAVTHPDGRNEHFPLGDGPTFVGQFPVRARGAYQVELLAEGEGGATVVANFPVYADVDPPATPDAVESTVNETEAQVTTTLLDMVNRARQAAGRPALQLMPGLASVAAAHSADMAAHHYIAHNSRTSGTPADRVHRAGLQSGLILENIGRGYSAREIHDGLMASPGHRANIVNPRVTHIGIGVARETGPGGGFVVTENFIEVGAAIDPDAAGTRLLEMVNNARTRRGAQALQLRPQLAQIGREAATAFFRAPPPPQQQVVDRANSEASRFGLIFRRVAVLATIVTRVEDAGSLEPLLEPAIGSIGIGVAQGTRPDTPPGAVFVVFVLGYPR